MRCRIFHTTKQLATLLLQGSETLRFLERK